jgi:carboxymethylenebutenolidase
MKKPEIEQGVFDLYDDYAHNEISRRQFVDRLGKYAIGGLTVAALMSHVMPKYESNRLILKDDPRLDSDFINYNSPLGGGEIKALLSQPKGNKVKLPGIVVVHENRGLNPYIEDVGRRAALENYISIAPDALSPLGGYPGNDDEGRAMQRERDPLKMLEDFIAAFEYLKNHPDCDGNIGVVGFCFGGWISNMMAYRCKDLKASVPYYGRQLTPEQTAEVKAPLCLQYAGLDKRVNAGWPEYKTDLDKANKTYEYYVYEGVNHGFHNNTTPRYDKSSADLSWKRTMAFFNKHLSES